MSFDVSGRRRLKKVLTVHQVRQVGDEAWDHGRTKDVSNWTTFSHRHPGRKFLINFLLIFYCQQERKLCDSIGLYIRLSLSVCLSLALSLSFSLYLLSLSYVYLYLSIRVSRSQSPYVYVFCYQDNIIIFENGEGNETFCVCFVHLNVCFCVFGGKHKFQAEGSRDSSAGGKKSRVTRKHVIIGVTCAVVVAMVITGVLVGVKFHLDSAHELVSVIYIAALLSRPSWVSHLELY